MFCKKCGNQLMGQEKFCAKCGEPVEVTTQNEQPAQAETEPAENPTQENVTEQSAPTQEAPAETTQPEAVQTEAAPAETTQPETVQAEATPAETTQPEAVQTEAAPVATTQSEGAAQPAQTSYNAQAGNYGAQAPYAGAAQTINSNPTAGTTPIKKSGKMPVGAIVGCVAVVAVLLVIVANAARFNNFIHKTFSKPEKYYQWVEKKAMKDAASSAGDIYDSIFLDNVNMYDRSVQEEITVELGKGGEDLLSLAGMAGVDLSWFKSASITAESAIKDNVVYVEVGAKLNKDDIISGNITMDMDEESMYVQIPDLTKQYLGIYLEDYLSSYDMMMFDEFAQAQEQTKNLMKAMPTKAQVEKLLNKYANTAFACIDDVDKSTKTVKAEGVSQKCTELKVTMDGDTFVDMVEAVAEQMMDDKDLEKLIKNIVDAMDDPYMDGEEAYDEFIDALDYLLDDIGYYGGSDEIVMKVWVNSKGEIVGRSISFDDGWDTYEITYKMPKNGSKFGYELSMDADGETVSLTGSGKESGNKLTGDFKLKYNGASIVDITAKKLDTKELKKGNLNGTFELQPSSGISNVLGWYYSSYASYLTDLKLTMECESKGDSGKVKLKVEYDGDDIGTISVSAKTGKGSKASIPADKNTIFAEDDDDLMDWLDAMDLDKYVTKLEKTDLPDDVFDVLYDIVYAIEDEDWYSLYQYMYYLY